MTTNITRLVIIREDNTVIINGVAISNLDLSSLDPDIKAVQWYGTSGEVEVAITADKHINIEIDNLDFVSDAILAWENASIVLPSAELSLEQVKECILVGVDNFFENVAKAKGYGTPTISATTSVLSYTGYENKYKAECLLFATWRTNSWETIHLELDRVIAQLEVGLLQWPATPQAAIALSDNITTKLPPMNW